MNSRGQQGDMLKMIIVAFMAIIVGISLFIAAGADIAETTNTVTVSEQTLTAPAANASINLNGKLVESGYTFVNATGRELITIPGNFTVENNQLVSGTLTARLTAGAAANEYQGTSILANYTYQPDGYISESGGRSVATLIMIFFALAIMVVALVPALRSGVMNLFSR